MITRVGNVIERLSARQHVALALATAALILTSPWIAMVRRIPHGAGLLDYGHVVVGFAALALGVTYALSCVRKGGWRIYFPWAAGEIRGVARDLGDLLHGRLPAVEGGGLFAMLEGLLLVLVLATAATGAAWFWTQGTAEALSWRHSHALLARGLAAIIVLHIVTVSLHVLDFIRD